MLLALGACATAAERAEPVLRDLLVKGTITQEQYDALMAALQGGGGWIEVIAQIGGVAATILLSALGITKGVPALGKALNKNQPA